MKVVAVADLHGSFPHELPPGDVLIIGGDCTSNDSYPAWSNFFSWLNNQPFNRKIIIAGNHDNLCKKWKNSDKDRNFEYLCDSGIEIDGVKFWGSPWSLWFQGINPHCKAFTGTESDLEKKYEKIPDDIDILITHTPPWGILDQVNDFSKGEVLNCGSRSLRHALNRIKPKVNIFGHIHEHGGRCLFLKHDGPNTWCYNASQMNEDYDLIYRPITFTV